MIKYVVVGTKKEILSDVRCDNCTTGEVFARIYIKTRPDMPSRGLGYDSVAFQPTSIIQNFPFGLLCT